MIILASWKVFILGPDCGIEPELSCAFCGTEPYTDVRVNLWCNGFGIGKMQFKLQLVAFLIILTLVGKSQSQYSLSWSDSIGDELTTSYPTSNDFLSYSSGLFDIEQFDVTGDDSQLNFEITIHNLPNPKDAPFGFTHPIIQIYIHSFPFGSYRINRTGTTTTIGNSHILIDPSFTWNLMLEITGWEVVLYTSEGEERREYTTAWVTSGNKINVQLPDHHLGSPQPFWSFTVLLAAYNFDTPENGKFREIQSVATEYSLGGGDDEDMDPNVIDILTYENSARSQSLLLYNYCKWENKYAILQPISNLPIPYPTSYGSSISIPRESGGNSCLNSDYQIQPRSRYVLPENSVIQQSNTGLGSVNDIKLEYIQSESNLQEYGRDLSELFFSVESVSESILHVTIEDTEKRRWKVGEVVGSTSKGISGKSKKKEHGNAKEDAQDMLYSYSFTRSPFGFSVSRLENQQSIFNSTPPIESSEKSKLFRNLVFKDRYIELSTQLPNYSHIFGLGERVFELLLKRNKTYTLWNVDQGTPYQNNLYGSHPIYIEIRDGYAHGVYMANNLGMDIQLGENKLTYKMIGGVIELYFFLGPSVDDVVKQYQSIVGLPNLPPYWSLGYHQSRWGYSNVSELRNVLRQFQENHLPVDVIWSDIDYMDQYKVFTTDPVSFPAPSLAEFVEELHDTNMRYVIIVDAGIKIENGYPIYEQAMQNNVFVKSKNSSLPAVGKVWPGPVHFVDFYNPSSDAFWSECIHDFHQSIPFDGIWLDMNEVSSFCDGHCVVELNEGNSEFECNCLEMNFDEENFIEYQIGEGGRTGMNVDSSTISLSSIHYNNVTEYNLHNLHSYLQCKSTYSSLQHLYNKRPFILSRSTFSGSGKYNAHWLGDNSATWWDLKYSISGMINMNLFSVPFVGADICGFNGNTNALLCLRWYQLGIFYPFCRNHNGIGFNSQEPYAFPIQVTNLIKSALEVRYSLISFYYSKLFEIARDGGTFIDSLSFLFPTDETTFSIEHQFMVGKSFMVVPVTAPDIFEIEIYFPPSRNNHSVSWYNYFTGEKVSLSSTHKQNAEEEEEEEEEEDYYTHENESNWKLFDVKYDSLFVFQMGGSIIPSQLPSLNTNLTKQNPLDFIVALENGLLSTLDFYIDDGEAIIAEQDTHPHNHWRISSHYNATAKYGEFRFYMSEFSEYFNLEDLKINEIKIYGITPPCSLVTFNNTEDIEFTYDHQLKVLVVPLNISIYQSFTIYWGSAPHKQPFLERVLILTGSLLFTLSILSTITLFTFFFNKKFPNFLSRRFLPSRSTNSSSVNLLDQEADHDDQNPDDVSIELDEIQTTSNTPTISIDDDEHPTSSPGSN